MPRAVHSLQKLSLHRVGLSYGYLTSSQVTMWSSSHQLDCKFHLLAQLWEALHVCRIQTSTGFVTMLSDSARGLVGHKEGQARAKSRAYSRLRKWNKRYVSKIGWCWSRDGQHSELRYRMLLTCFFSDSIIFLASSCFTSSKGNESFSTGGCPTDATDGVPFGEVDLPLPWRGLCHRADSSNISLSLSICKCAGHVEVTRTSPSLVECMK